jgi:hypothetical protein
VYCVYFLWHVLLHLFVPGPTKKGVKLTDGRHLPYLLNGLTCFCLTVAMALGVQRYKFLGQYDLVWVYDHWAEVTMATIIFSWILSFFLYFYSFKADAQVLFILGIFCGALCIYRPCLCCEYVELYRRTRNVYTHSIRTRSWLSMATRAMPSKTFSLAVSLTRAS